MNNGCLLDPFQKKRYLTGAHESHGFTLIELLVVVAIICIASVAVALSLRPSTNAALQNAEQLAAVLETSRANAQAQNAPLLWRCDATGISVQSLTPNSLNPLQYSWAAASKGSLVICDPAQGIISVDPLIRAQSINVYTKTGSDNDPNNAMGVAQNSLNDAVQIATDGLGPFKVMEH